LSVLKTQAFRGGNGRHMILFVGSGVEPQTALALFGVDRLDAIQPTYGLPVLEHAHNVQLRKLVAHLRSQSSRFINFTICRQGIDSQEEARFASMMVEDAKFENLAYTDYIVQIHRAIDKELSMT
ncbi:COPII coat Sec23p-Sfb3p heterodimer component, partial [Kappamyces sp. JEL0680]